MENRPDGLFSVSSFVPERHKTGRPAGGRSPKRSGMEETLM